MGNLQKLINDCAASCDAHYRATKALDEYCEAVYGCSPCDIDCDWIIDGLYGGCGGGGAMTAKRFEKEMRNALELKNQ
jgi:hypothetical protein